MRGLTITATFKDELSNYVNVLFEDRKTAHSQKQQVKKEFRAIVANQTEIEKKALKIALIQAITTYKAKKAAHKAVAKMVKPLLKEAKVPSKTVKKASKAVAISTETAVPNQNKVVAKVKKTVPTAKTKKTATFKKNEAVVD